MAQLIVIVEVLIAERHSEHALADQRLDLVLDQVLAARVAEAGGEPIDETDRPVGRAKQHRAGVRGDASAVESSHHPTSFNRFKFKQIRDTVCLHRGTSRVPAKLLLHNILSLIRGLDAPTSLRNPG